jgi:opacity protein-like surface antigen
MKKNLFLLVFALTGWLANNAQVTQSYDLQTTTGTYDDVTGGTVVPATGTGQDFQVKVYDASGTVHTEDFTGNGYQIGFNFKFDNKQMNQFMVSSDGYILLGKDNIDCHFSF